MQAERKASTLFTSRRIDLSSLAPEEDVSSRRAVQEIEPYQDITKPNLNFRSSMCSIILTRLRLR